MKDKNKDNQWKRKEDLEKIGESSNENKGPSEVAKFFQLKNTNEDWNSKNKMIKRGQ